MERSLRTNFNKRYQTVWKLYRIHFPVIIGGGIFDSYTSFYSTGTWTPFNPETVRLMIGKFAVFKTNYRNYGLL